MRLIGTIFAVSAGLLAVPHCALSNGYMSVVGPKPLWLGRLALGPAVALPRLLPKPVPAEAALLPSPVTNDVPTVTATGPFLPSEPAPLLADPATGPLITGMPAPEPPAPGPAPSGSSGLPELPGQPAISPQMLVPFFAHPGATNRALPLTLPLNFLPAQPAAPVSSSATYEKH
jgi:hypothetical protein